VSELHVACSAQGEAYAAHSAAMLHSVHANSGGMDVRVHYLHGPEFDPEWRDKIAQVAPLIEFHEIADDRVTGLPSNALLTDASWYRIFLPELLPAEARVLYLDVDTLATDSLAPLWETDLGDDWIAAVTNVMQHNDMERHLELGLSGPEVYFNAGVLLMNLDAWRRDGLTRRLYDYSTENPERLGWLDQDALNVVLGGRRTPLHPRWNCMNSVMRWESAKDVFGAEQVEQARARPGIRHFEGPAANKPWHWRADRAGRELYLEHRRATPWPEVELEGRPRLRDRLLRA
jgi:lipopolysaccharide biosynthesis glycosyltransferase